MVIVRLMGGLGNQMFQYALGRSLAEKHSTLLKLDISCFENYTLRSYELHCFNICEHLASKQEVNAVCSRSNSLAKPINMLTSILPSLRLENQNHVKERSFAFNSKVLDAPNNILLDGYWQSEKYFATIENILRQEFVVKYKQNSQNIKIAEKIICAEAVSIHIRRADYIADKRTNEIHGTCSNEYFQKAVEYVNARVALPHYFVFSDDPEWARNNLVISGPMTIVDINDSSRGYEDLRLMSLCRHHIIANSTFSWWGAWLNQSQHKIVVAPSRWFNNSKRNAKDVIPESWIII